MITRTEIGRRFGEFGEGVLNALGRFDWSQPFQASVEELGLAMGTHIGLKRKRNEDRIAAARINAPNGDIYTLTLVCDGVGGSEFGDQAATLAIAAIVLELNAQTVRRPLPEIAAHAVRCADEAVRRELGGRGTTTLCMYLSTSTGQAVCISIGDSRAYSWTAGAKLLQVSIDDTFENELKGLPGDHDALLNFRGLKERLSQAIGEADRSSSELLVRLYLSEPFSTGLLLGSDGMWKLAKDFELVMANSRTAIDAVRRGITLANWVGGVDNSSLVAIDDVRRFSDVKKDQQENLYSISLWIGASKFFFLNNVGRQWLDPSSIEKSKRKQSKPKKIIDAPAEKQMEIPVEKSASQELRPIIEVTISPKDKN